MNIGLKIREARLKKGWSQQRLADILGCHQVTIARYETGKNNPQIDNLTKIAKVLKTSVKNILG